MDVSGSTDINCQLQHFAHNFLELFANLQKHFPFFHLMEIKGTNYSKYFQFHTHHQTEMSASVQCLLCPLKITVESGIDAQLEKHMEEKHSVGLRQKGFILAIHLLTKAERGRIELWMASRKLESSQEDEKKQEDKDPSKDISKSSNIDTDFILIDDEDEEIECCYDSKEQSINALRSTLFSSTTTLTSGKNGKSSSSLELPYENKTVRTKIRPRQSILKGTQMNNVKLGELFDAKVALAKMLKKIREDEKHEEAEEGASNEEEKEIGVVDIEQQKEREEPLEENKFDEMGRKEESEAEDAEQQKYVEHEENVEQEGDVEHEEDVEQEEDVEHEDDVDEHEEDVEDVQARPFHSNVPNLIFSTLF